MIEGLRGERETFTRMWFTAAGRSDCPCSFLLVEVQQTTFNAPIYQEHGFHMKNGWVLPVTLLFRAYLPLFPLVRTIERHGTSSRSKVCALCRPNLGWWVVGWVKR